MTVREILQTMAYGPVPESPEPALQWLEAHGRRIRLFIGNRWVEPARGEFFETTNPATGTPLAQFSRASAEDVDAAVQAATAALGPWRATPGSVRARSLYALARQVQRHAALLAVLETLDTGTPIQKAREVEIPLVVRHFLHYAGSAHLTERVFPHYEPVGVCGQILPWRFPLLSLAQRIAPALAAGCTVVLRPSEFTPLGAMALCDLVEEAGLPPGVVNVVTGDAQVDGILVDHPGVHQIAFTGPPQVGRILRERTAGTGKVLALEFEDNLPFVVLDCADLDSAVEGVLDAIGFGLHLLVQESVADRFLMKLQARMERLRVGDPLDRTVDFGPIVASAHLEETRRLCEIAVLEGARMWQPSWEVPKEGLYFPPTLLTDVAPSCTIARAEASGPVLVMMTFRTAQEAVELANTSRYGPRASVWTEDIGTALEIAHQIRVGTVWVNGTNLFEARGCEGVREYLKLIQRPSPPSPGPRGGVPDSGGTVEAAVELARRAFPRWRDASGYTRAQILHRAAENLEGCSAEFVGRIAKRMGDAEGARREVEAAIRRLFAFAARADKVEGRVYPVHPPRHLVVAVPEPVGVIGIVCPEEAPLLSLVTLTSAAIAAGNTVVVVPSESHTVAASDFVRVLEASDVPAGVVNVLTGARESLGRALAQHDGVDAVWYFGPVEGIRFIELASAGNLKRTWVSRDAPWNLDEEEVLYRATRVKTIWIPYGA